MKSPVKKIRSSRKALTLNRLAKIGKTVSQIAKIKHLDVQPLLDGIAAVKANLNEYDEVTAKGKIIPGKKAFNYDSDLI